MALFTVIPTVLLWTPFFARLKDFWGIPLPQNGMGIIVANYDGPLYLVVAKTFYNQDLIKSSFQFPLPTQYYAAHFPLFPLLIRIFAGVMGYPYSMLIVTLISSFLAILFFNRLIKNYVEEESVLFLTFLFSIFPARWLIVRSIGSADPLFIASIIASVYFFTNKKYLYAGIWGAIATLTKSPGILLFVAYSGIIISSNFKDLIANQVVKLKIRETTTKFLSILPIVLSLLMVFSIFKITYNDFFAYFHSGDNIHLSFPPFQIFNYAAPWVGTFWLEEIIFIYLFGVLGLLRLIKQKNYELAWLVGVFFTSILFVSHRDLMRYFLPIVPFLFVAFADVLKGKEFKVATIFILIPIFLYSLTFISQNVMPISDWTPLL
ncbi:hypothetical protein HY045_00780 [Candidatus Woesebacteria bacterium]|nr:hypothetical protein [Candidatus Woesebacteria bacterium]